MTVPPAATVVGLAMKLIVGGVATGVDDLGQYVDAQLILHADTSKAETQNKVK